MADFFARVELHRARWPDDYKTLHSALAKHGFTNCITFGNGEKKRLPTGFYFSTNRIDDVPKVAQAVKDCADSTGYSNEVTVVKGAGSYSFLSLLC